MAELSLNVRTDAAGNLAPLWWWWLRVPHTVDHTELIGWFSQYGVIQRRNARRWMRTYRVVNPF